MVALAFLLFARPGKLSGLMEDLGKGIKGFRKGMTDRTTTPPPAEAPPRQVADQSTTTTNTTDARLAKRPHVLPSLGFQEIVLLASLLWLSSGPKDLPLLLRKLGRWMARLRGMANEFRSGFDELARQAELDELKKEVDALRRHSSFSDITRDFENSYNNPPPQQDVIPHDSAYGAQAALPAPESDASIGQPEPEQLADMQSEASPESAESPPRLNESAALRSAS